MGEHVRVFQDSVLHTSRALPTERFKAIALLEFISKFDSVIVDLIWWGGFFSQQMHCVSVT